MAVKTEAQKPLEDELITLRSRAALLKETEDNFQALTKALDVATTEKDIVVAEAKIEAEAHEAAKAVATFRNSKFLLALHKRYNSGWDAAMRCVRKSDPQFV